MGRASSRNHRRAWNHSAMTAVLTVDVGGSNVKTLLSGETERRRSPSGPKMTAAEMVDAVHELVDGWDYEAVSVGIPAPVRDGRVVAEPVNMGTGWAGFDFEAAFGRPTRVVNDAAMQALGSYEGGKMLFLGLGTGLGSSLAVDGRVAPMELGHLPYRKGTFEEYVGEEGLRRRGFDRWSFHVQATIDSLVAALQADYVVLGGGNARKLKELPDHVRLGANGNAFVGGFRLWDPDAPGRIVA
jgi:polyphosphate glucokinase